jgi:phage gpG-like protein
MKIAFQVKGADDLARRLAELSELPGLPAVLADSAEQVREEARRALNDGRPPDSRSGALAASLAIDQVEDGFAVGTDVDYGAFLEFGTRRMPQMPWLGPALRRSATSIHAAVGRMLRAAVRRHG